MRLTLSSPISRVFLSLCWALYSIIAESGTELGANKAHTGIPLCRQGTHSHSCQSLISGQSRYSPGKQIPNSFSWVLDPAKENTSQSAPAELPTLGDWQGLLEELSDTLSQLSLNDQDDNGNIEPLLLSNTAEEESEDESGEVTEPQSFAESLLSITTETGKSCYRFKNESMMDGTLITGSTATVVEQESCADHTYDHKDVLAYAFRTVYGKDTDTSYVRGVDLATDKPNASPNASTTGSGNGYKKPNYTVLLGNAARVFNTKLYASLPQHNKFLVKVRDKEKCRLVLKSGNPDHYQGSHYGVITSATVGADGDTEDADERVQYFRQNLEQTGYCYFTKKHLFSGSTKYPLPSAKASERKIGRGGNGFVFTIFHNRKEYAVKKTIFRSNEVSVHTALKHKNILRLDAILIGDEHERHKGKFYCFYFMPKMDYDLRTILSIKDAGSLKNVYSNTREDPAKWQSAFNNIKFILGKTLEALSYIHKNGYIHRDIKASNIMVKMACKCAPLYCDCPGGYQVKLGDFDSAGPVPGLGITEPTDQIIKFASILPLGTPGYRAPEVSMHIVLAGPYETLYTTSVDMWSFGCLCMNLSIGKTPAIRQREEASLLLSRSRHICGEGGNKLWRKITKYSDLEDRIAFKDDKIFLNIIKQCLAVDPKKRFSSQDLVETGYFKTKPQSKN